ncbi:MAG: porin [Gammaproteobacteria bacterium]|nr:porin [Gammaproteobacteria bacterium]
MTFRAFRRTPAKKPRNKLLAAAAAAALAPLPAAHAQLGVYGRIANHIERDETAADNPFTTAADAGADTVDINGLGGRFGMTFDSDVFGGPLGDMRAHARYEFAAETDKEGTGVKDTRVAIAGVSGGFGRIDVGNQWSAYFNTFGTLVSPTYTLGYHLYSSVGNGVFRSSNTLKYSNSMGPVSAEFDIRLNDSNETAATAEKIRGEGYGLGISVALGRGMTLGLAVDNEEGVAGENAGSVGAFTADTVAGDGILGSFAEYDAGDHTRGADRAGIALQTNFDGGYWLSVGWQNYRSSELPGISAAGFDGNDNAAADAPAGNITLHRRGQDIDSVFVYGGGNLFSEKTTWLLGYAQADDIPDRDQVGIQYTGADGEEKIGVLKTAVTEDSEQFVWGVYREIGAGLNLYYEGTVVYSDAKMWDGVRHLGGVRVRF